MLSRNVEGRILMLLNCEVFGRMHAAVLDRGFFFLVVLVVLVAVDLFKGFSSLGIPES